MNTTWYLHSHVVWLKLSNLSIVASSPLVCLAAHEGKSPRWTHLEMSNFYCHPGRAGGTPFGISVVNRYVIIYEIINCLSNTEWRGPHLVQNCFRVMLLNGL